MRVKSIRAAGRADVYNMEVEDTHSFVLESGVAAHNCYDELRYVLMANPMSPRPPAKRRVMVWDPLDLDPLKQERKLGRYDYYIKGA